MREILFRGRNINGEWFVGLLSISQGRPGQPEKGYYISNKAGMPWAYQVDPSTVGQDTGLKDKNGTPIYEGDIVKCGKGKDANTALVIFKQQAFLLLYLPKEKKVSDNVYDYMEDYKYFTVLGNEYESPELLNKQ